MNNRPEMIERATRNAREVAEIFSLDSRSRLGKIRTADQGQFSIQNRDRNMPYIKKIRIIVSTVEYYFVDQAICRNGLYRFSRPMVVSGP